MAYQPIGIAATSAKALAWSPKAPDPGALYDAAERGELEVRAALSDADMVDAIGWLVEHGVIDAEMAERIEQAALEFTELRLSREAQ